MPFDPCLTPEHPLWMVFHHNSKWWPMEWAEVRRRASARARVDQPAVWQFRRRPFLSLPKALDCSALSASLGRTLLVRRSAREFAALPLDWQEMSTILWATAGLASAEDSSHRRRTVPSAGACYPIETFFWLPTPPAGRGCGPYHYDPYRHGATELLPESATPLGTLLAACAYPALVERAGLLIVLAAVFERTTAVYGGRGYRFLLLEAGHMAQNTYLVGAALGLGTVALGGWDDAVLDAALGLDGVYAGVLYTIAVGRINDAPGDVR